jgi:hypothetical protein
MKYLICVFLTLAMPCWAVVSTSEENPQRSYLDTYPVLFPGDNRAKIRSAYQVALLELALSYSKYNFDVKPNGRDIHRARNHMLLKDNQFVHILWTATTPELEENFLPIKIPVLRGLLGFRIPLVHADTPDILKFVSTPEDLQQLVAGQLVIWSDTKILRSNDIPVTNGSNFGALFHMLSIKRFDYFPRSIAEVYNDWSMFRALPIAIDKHIAIYYPNVMYFFVNKQNTFLHKEILDGLEKAIQNGSFEKLFHLYHAQNIEKANLRNRRIITLKNPLLPDQLPTHRPELWLDLINQ